MATRKNKPKALIEINLSRKVIKGVLVSLGIIVAVVITLIIVLTTGDNTTQLRVATARTCEVTVDNFQRITDKRPVSHNSDEGINPNPLEGDYRMAIYVLWLDNLVPVIVGTDKESCSKDDSTPNANSKAVDGFIDYVNENKININDLMSSDKSYLNYYGQNIFLKSLTASYADDIKTFNSFMNN